VFAIDDGSTDGTREWLAEQSDVQVYFNEINLGTYGTLNVALSRTDSELVCVLNDDDLWLPTKLQEQVDLLDSHPEVGLVHTNGHFIDGSGQQRAGNPLGFRFPTFETGDILLGLVYENKIIASAAMVRRECFRKVGVFNDAYFGSGDWEMWFRIAEAYQIGCVQSPLTLYRVHGANASHKLERIWRDDQMLREWMLPRLERLESRFPAQEVLKAQAFNFAALGTVLKLNGDASGARRAYRESVGLDPRRWQTYARWAASYLPPRIFRKLL
jgi:glycosyltransferase involved in cell wall biosynthesis